MRAHTIGCRSVVEGDVTHRNKVAGNTLAVGVYLLEEGPDWGGGGQKYRSLNYGMHVDSMPGLHRNRVYRHMNTSRTFYDINSYEVHMQWCTLIDQ